jgi:phosphoenolpyruvate carboxykinase (ATP)
MRHEGPHVSRSGLDRHGIGEAKTVYWNLPPARLYELALERDEASLAAEGPLVCLTGQHTGRSPNDKFLVKDPSIDADIWWGEVNRPFERERFEALLARAADYVKEKDLFVFQGMPARTPATGCRCA